MGTFKELHKVVKCYKGSEYTHIVYSCTKLGRITNIASSYFKSCFDSVIIYLQIELKNGGSVYYTTVNKWLDDDKTHMLKLNLGELGVE